MTQAASSSPMADVFGGAQFAALLPARGKRRHPFDIHHPTKTNEGSVMGRRVLAIVAALLVALLGAAGVVVYAQSADARAVAGQATQQVYIAAAPGAGGDLG